jgi:serine protease Do
MGRKRADAGRAFLLRLVLAALLAAAPAAGFAPPLFADDAATATPITASIADSLKRVLDGAAPAGVADLRAMQTHVQKLTGQLSKCTVGVQVGRAQGSGVVISKEGYVLTAAHVAGQPNQEVTFVFSDGREVNGKTLGLCRTIDAGLMKITDPGDYPFAEMGMSDSLKEGQWCLAMGHPGGYQRDRGAVLRLGRIVLLTGDAITTDCTLVGGDSGGPLFDMDGRVIGINSRIAGALTANMHAPISAYKDSWDRLEKGEAWGQFPGQESYLGVRGAPDAADARIAVVNPGSPAERAGLKVGDVVLKFGDKEITDFQSLRAAVAERQPRDRVNVLVRRGEETLELRVRLGSSG